jgi:hypothetical protein
MREHGPFIWLPTVAGTAEPLAADLAEILDGAVHRAVLLDQRLDNVVHRHELVGVARRQPGREGQHIVTGLGLRFGGGREQQLVALRRDVVDRDFDLLLVGPFLDQRLAGLVGAGNPVVPQTEREFAGGIGAANKGCRDHCGRQSGRTSHETTTTDSPGSHQIPPISHP